MHKGSLPVPPSPYMPSGSCTAHLSPLLSPPLPLHRTPPPAPCPTPAPPSPLAPPPPYPWGPAANNYSHNNPINHSSHSSQVSHNSREVVGFRMGPYTRVMGAHARRDSPSPTPPPPPHRSVRHMESCYMLVQGLGLSCSFKGITRLVYTRKLALLFSTFVLDSLTI